MNSSPFLPAAPSTLNVGADDPVRHEAPVCKGPRSGGTGVNDMPRLGMPAGICRRRRLRDCRARQCPPATNLIALPAVNVGATIGRPRFFLEPILFFLLLRKEKNGFNLPRKEREQRAYRCPEFDSENLSHQLSVASIPTARKVSALCSRLSEMPSMRFQHCTRPPPQRIAYPSGEGVT